MLTLISTILVLGVLIFFHELGHFLTAKKFGVKVEKFSIGFGPKIFKFVKGETEYKISMLPIGGYVKMAGEDLEEEELREKEPLKAENDDKAFYNQKPGKRALIIVAGSMANYILGIAIFIIIFMSGVPALTSKIGSVQENGPAAIAGIKQGDKVTAIDNRPVWKWEDMAKTIQESSDKKLLFTIDRNGEKIELEVIPKTEERATVFMEKIKVGMIGITSSFDYVKEKYGPVQSVKKAFGEAFFISGNIVKGIYFMVTGRIKAEVAGPLGIIQITGQQAKLGLLSLLFFAAFLSINLATINLFPIPALDGGHLMFLLIEKIKGTPVKIKHRLIAQQVGWMLLILLLLFASYNDILRSDIFKLSSIKKLGWGLKSH